MNIAASILIDVIMITAMSFFTGLSVGKKQDVGFFLVLLCVWIFIFLLDIKELYEH